MSNRRTAQRSAEEKMSALAALMAAAIDLVSIPKASAADTATEVAVDLVDQLGGGPDELLQVGHQVINVAYEAALGGSDGDGGDADAGDGEGDGDPGQSEEDAGDNGNGEGDDFDPDWDNPAGEGDAQPEAPPRRRRRTRPAASGSARPAGRAKLDPKVRARIVKALDDGKMSQAKIAEKFGVSRSTVSTISTSRNS